MPTKLARAPGLKKKKPSLQKTSVSSKTSPGPNNISNVNPTEEHDLIPSLSISTNFIVTTPVTSFSSCQDHFNSVDCNIVTPLGVRILPNQIRLHPSLLGALCGRRSIKYGDHLLLSTSEADALCMALPFTGISSTTISLTSVAVAEETAGLLCDRQGTLFTLTDPLLLVTGMEMTISAGNSSIVDEVFHSSTLQQQLVATVRNSVRFSAVYVKMRLRAIVAAHPLEVKVVCLMDEIGDHVKYGIASDLVMIRFVSVFYGKTTEDNRQVKNELRVGENSTDSQGINSSKLPVTNKKSDLLEVTDLSYLPSFPERHTLICGASGVGKSFLLSQYAQIAQAEKGKHVIFFDLFKIIGCSNKHTTSTELLTDFVISAIRPAAPCVVLIDDIDVVVGNVDAGSSFTMYSFLLKLADIIAHFGASLSSSNGNNNDKADVLFIVTSKTIDNVPPILRTRFCFNNIIELYPPDRPQQRAQVLATALHVLAKNHPHATINSISLAGVLEVAENTHGFNQRDLSKLAQVSLADSFNRSRGAQITDEDLRSAARVVHPSVLHSAAITDIPHVHWSDIGGSEEAKRVLKECVEWSLGKQQWIFHALKLSPPKGVLLYGPPGCSKTLLAKALANESKMNFISVKGPEVFSKWVGDSEKAVREIFRQARAAAPCVIFIDELDGLCGHRGDGGGGGVSDRVISQLLTELDGLPAVMGGVSGHDNQGSNSSRASIVLVAATNRPENIDTAVLRPGRIDRKIYVGLPCYEERVAIAYINLKNTPREEEKVTAEEVAKRTEGYTGAEVVAVCKEAAFQALERSLQAERVEWRDLDAACKKVRPRVTKKEVEWYKIWGKSLLA